MISVGFPYNKEYMAHISTSAYTFFTSHKRRVRKMENKIIELPIILNI